MYSGFTFNGLMSKRTSTLFPLYLPSVISIVTAGAFSGAVVLLALTLFLYPTILYASEANGCSGV